MQKISLAKGVSGNQIQSDIPGDFGGNAHRGTR